ncbi:MAG: Fe(3+) ABC transporter substrate-binding protein [Hyphomicrobiales bacterium]|nr:Fe(3+) ABC transporter substrate-binding protein [Hyphomicrobiales bacterium]
MKNTPFGRGVGCVTLSLAFSVFAGSLAIAAEEVNVYSYRQPYLIERLLEAFKKKTGIQHKIIFAKKGLIERIAAEGKNSPADVLLTVDIGRLTGAVSKGITQPVSSKTLEQNIPEQYRDSQGQWFGLTRRGRVIYASRERVKQQQISYENLADPKWKGKICVRSGQHVYNVALIASMIAHHGEKRTEEWLRGFKNNLARKPAGNDRAQVKGVYSGECDLALGNTYYMAKMQLNEKKPEQKEWAKSVRMVFPNTDDRGTHINLSGMVLAKNAPHKENAVKLMEFLSSDEAQKIYAEVNHEYPVKDGIAWSSVVKNWGTFKSDTLALEDIATLRKKASELVDKVAFNAGPSS